MKQIRIAIEREKSVQMELMKKNVKKLFLMIRATTELIIKINVFGKVKDA